MKFKITFAQYTAGEAESITGMSQDAQRDLRRRELVSRQEGGKARHDVHGLACLLTIRALQDQGIGPSRSAEIGEKCSPKIALLALNVAKAVDDRTNGALDISRRKRSRGAYLLDSTDEAPGWAVIWQDGKITFHENLADDFKSIPAERRMTTVALDLDLFAQILVGRAPRPFVTVETK